MRDVLLALMPAAFVAVLVFGLRALYTMLLTTAFCIIFEYIFNHLILKKKTINDLSAAVTGLLLAMNLPSNAPWWIMAIGAFVAIVIAKISFGGLGNNPFNPALVGRVVLLISWPSIMTTWQKPQIILSIKELFSNFDVVTAATPLSILQERGVTELMKTDHLYAKLFFGYCGGSLGEISAFALIIGGIYLFMRGHITWHIPLTFIGSVFLIGLIFHISDPARYADPIFHILSGGVMLGAIFMATDMVTSPLTNKGMIIFGIGCGIITMIIRLFGAYPEGVSFSILIMNAFTPLIDKLTAPQRYGFTKKIGGK